MRDWEEERDMNWKDFSLGLLTGIGLSVAVIIYIGIKYG